MHPRSPPDFRLRRSRENQPDGLRAGRRREAARLLRRLLQYPLPTPQTG